MGMFIAKLCIKYLRDLANSTIIIITKIKQRWPEFSHFRKLRKIINPVSRSITALQIKLFLHEIEGITINVDYKNRNPKQS